MTLTTPLKLKGAPGSPYTRKMLAYMRYRHIPYEFLYEDEVERRGLPQPKVSLLPTFYLEDSDGELSAHVDSTPLIRRFENEFAGRTTIPADPAMAFISYLIEDYADEWLTKAMFHYRWHYEADTKMAAAILPRWRNLQASDEKLDKLSAFIAERQIARLYVVGSNDITAPVIEDSYKRFLGLFDRLIEQQKFTLGARPSVADFGLYAQLTQLAKFDPTPAAICMQMAPRVYAWTDVMDDLSGHPAADDGWLNPTTASETLRPLLSEIGRVYTPALLANAAAIASGADSLETEIDGRKWVQPPFVYQAKCLATIREQYAALPDASRQQVDQMLEGTECDTLLR